MGFLVREGVFFRVDFKKAESAEMPDPDLGYRVQYQYGDSTHERSPVYALRFEGPDYYYYYYYYSARIWNLDGKDEFLMTQCRKNDECSKSEGFAFDTHFSDKN
jgi:hypothetical protein